MRSEGALRADCKDARCQLPDARSFADIRKLKLREAFHPCAKHREGDRSLIY